MARRRDVARQNNVTIVLYDSNKEVVLIWTLRNARPSAWTGPDLDATNSKVATETLELTHEGFDVVSGERSGGRRPWRATHATAQAVRGRGRAWSSLPARRRSIVFKGQEIKGNGSGPGTGNRLHPPA